MIPCAWVSLDQGRELALVRYAVLCLSRPMAPYSCNRTDSSLIAIEKSACGPASAPRPDHSPTPPQAAHHTAVSVTPGVGPLGRIQICEIEPVIRSY